MARKQKPSTTTQIKIRIREDTRRRLEKAAEIGRRSINAEMAWRLDASFDRQDMLTLRGVAADMENRWARYGQLFHELNKQGDLIRATEALVEQVEGLPADTRTKAMAVVVEKVKQAIKVIEIEAAKLPGQMHTTGGEQ
jgi:hypothetical protein